MPMVQDKCPLKQALPYVRKYTGLRTPLSIVYGEHSIKPLRAYCIFDLLRRGTLEKWLKGEGLEGKRATKNFKDIYLHAE